MNSLALFAVLLIAAIAVQALVIRWIGDTSRGARFPYWLAVIVVVVNFVLAVLIWGIAHPLLPGDDDLIGGPQIFFAATWLLGLGYFVHWRKAGVLRGFGRWFLFGLVVTIQYFLFAFVIEEFVLQSCREMGVSSMTPTIQGFHSTQTCPKCGGTFYVGWFRDVAPDGTEFVDERFRKPGVCERCLYSADVPSHVPPLRRPDHYVVNHLLPPKRWRIVAFHIPRTTGGFPQVGRLVGLPGETVFLRDGAVWINGQKLDVPDYLPPFRYTEKISRPILDLGGKKRTKCFGHPDEALTLSSSEYFILHDDPDGALDSRVHGPYQDADYMGTVDAIFWPPRRWRLLP